MKCVGTWVIGFFLPIIFIGAFFLLNLTIAVIKSKYSEEIKNQKSGKSKKKKKRRKRGNRNDNSEDDLEEEKIEIEK